MESCQNILSLYAHRGISEQSPDENFKGGINQQGLSAVYTGTVHTFESMSLLLLLKKALKY